MEPVSFHPRHNAVRGVLRLSVPIVAIALLAACSSGADDAPPTGLRLAATPTPVSLWKVSPPSVVESSFPSYGLSFSHPSAWHAIHYDSSSSFSTSIAYMSTERLHDPCTTTTTDRTGVAIRCGSPLGQLRPGGVLIAWSSFGMPGSRLFSQPGDGRRIAGHPARVVVGPANAACAELGGDLSEGVQIQQDALGSHDQLVQMSACLRGPGIAADQAAVQRMLDSVRLTSRP